MRSTRTPPSEPSSVRVVEAVADRTETPPTELPPLSNVLDTEALDILIASLDDGEVSFHYMGYTVTVNSTGTVHVTQADTDT